MSTNPLITSSDKELLLRIAQHDVKAFEVLFKRYYKELCYYSQKYVSQMSLAEEIVSGMFTNLWEKRQSLEIAQSVKAYLYTSTKNASLNYLKSQFARQKFGSEDTLLLISSSEHFSGPMDYEQLEEVIHKGIEALPPRCRIIFTLSRHAGLSYEEIAQELGISKKTVKAQMGIALDKMREYVGKHWDSLLMLLLPFI